MDYEKLVAVTNRKICYEKHFNKDFNSENYDYILGSFPMLRNISDNERDYCIILVNQILELVKHNIPIIILREKDMQEADYELLAKIAIYICKLSNTRFILHSFYNVAIKLHHPYIHLPLHMLADICENNEHTKLDFFESIGSSVHSVEDALLAKNLGATYITAGHIYDTDCKKGLPGRGLSFLQNVCSTVDIPVYAIGGISEENINRSINAGASLCCMMSGLM